MEEARYGIQLDSLIRLPAHTRAWLLGLAVLMILARSAQAQWTGGPTGPVYYNGGNLGWELHFRYGCRAK